MLSKKAKRREEARLQAMRQQATVPEPKAEQPVSNKEGKLHAFFDAHHKKLMLIPTLLVLFAILQIGYQISTTGDFVKKSVSLEGGTTITILREMPQLEIPETRVTVEGERTIVETSSTDPAAIDAIMQRIKAEAPQLTPEEYTVEIIGAALGESFFRQTMIAILVAFVFMSIVVLISFRSFAPSFFVILAAASDIITTLAIFNILGLELSTAGIAAFLMLIGYSIDTDVLLSTRVLRRKEGTITDATINAMGTGLTMSITTAIASLVGVVLAKSAVLQQIMLIIFIGVCMDMVYTWLQNAPILKWYLERKVHHGKA